MEEPFPTLRNALELVATLEAHCRQLQEAGGDGVQDTAAELQKLLSEIRKNLEPPTDH